MPHSAIKNKHGSLYLQALLFEVSDRHTKQQLMRLWKNILLVNS